MAQQEDPLDELACRLEQNSAQVSSGVPHAPIAQFLASASKLSTPPEIRARLAETVGQLAKLEAELAQGARAKARLKQTCADSLSALETLQRRRLATPGGEEEASTPPMHTGFTVHHFSPVASIAPAAVADTPRADPPPSEPLSTARVRVNPKFAWHESRLRPPRAVDDDELPRPRRRASRSGGAHAAEDLGADAQPRHVMLAEARRALASQLREQSTNLRDEFAATVPPSDSKHVSSVVLWSSVAKENRLREADAASASNDRVWLNRSLARAQHARVESRGSPAAAAADRGDDRRAALLSSVPDTRRACHARAKPTLSLDGPTADTPPASTTGSDAARGALKTDAPAEERALRTARATTAPPPPPPPPEAESARAGPTPPGSADSRAPPADSLLNASPSPSASASVASSARGAAPRPESETVDSSSSVEALRRRLQATVAEVNVLHTRLDEARSSNSSVARRWAPASSSAIAATAPVPAAPDAPRLAPPKASATPDRARREAAAATALFDDDADDDRAPMLPLDADLERLLERNREDEARLDALLQEVTENHARLRLTAQIGGTSS